MTLRRVGILLGKELVQGPKNFIFIWAVVAPIVISLIFSLVFGTLLTDKPKLGMVTEGSSQLITKIRELDSVDSKEYSSVSEIKQAVGSGAVDVGIVIPKDFESSVRQGVEAEITVYVWGESLAKNRTILGITVVNLIRELTGQKAPVEIEAITLGGEVGIPWSDRLLPLIVLMAVFVGGLFLPATSVINEKEKKTLGALLITPTTIGDVFLAKGLLGIILSLFMGLVILVLNQAFGAEPLLLLLVLALGAIMASELGVLFGAVIKDITTMFAIWKFGGILLFGPALVYMFPQIPEWVGRIFPTYYLIQPIIEISQRGSTWPDIATSVFILVGLDMVLAGVVMYIVRRTNLYTF